VHTAQYISIEYDYLMLLCFLKNIANKRAGTYTTSYEYDSLNQLIRVNDEKAGKTYTYSYTNGNITECNEYDYTTAELNVPLSTKTWTYDDSTWSDLLTNYNGTPITYDEIGNPLTIGEKSLTWNGRQLQSITDSNSEIAYTYNGDGLRTSKTVNGKTTEYFYNGSILAGQKTGNDTLVFMYDNNSDIFGFIYNDVEYYYVKNAQNDVVAIADKDANIIVKYTYDPWGKVGSITSGSDDDITNLEDDINQAVLDLTTGESKPVLDENGNPVTSASESVILARINPILYRSYYYDKEMEWYYLQTRYYSPDMCRFINADDPEILLEDQDSLQEYNLFAYCLNNPVVMFDEDGQAAANIIGAIIGGAVGAGLGYLLAKHLGLTGWKKAALIAAAAVGGAVLGAFLGPYVAKLSKSIGTVTKSVFKRAIKYKKATENANKIHHIFSKSQHKLGNLLCKFNGNERKTFNAIYNATFKQVKKKGIIGTFETVVKVQGQNVTVRGSVVNGIVRIGTIFIK